MDSLIAFALLRMLSFSVGTVRLQVNPTASDVEQRKFIARLDRHLDRTDDGYGSSTSPGVVSS